MERQLEGEADLSTAGGRRLCGPVNDDEDEMRICDASTRWRGPTRSARRHKGRRSTTRRQPRWRQAARRAAVPQEARRSFGRRVRGEAFDDEAPTVMAEGDEASSSAPPAAKRNRGRKRAGKQAKMNHHQRDDMTERRERGERA